MEIQSSYFSYLFALGIGQSLVLIYALLKSGISKHLSRIYFALLLFIFTLEIFFGFLYQTGSIFDFSYLLRVNTPFVLAIGPLMLLTFSHLLNGDRKFQNSDLWHFLPFLVSLIYFIPLYFQTTAFKIEYLKVMFEDVHQDSLIFGTLRRAQQPIYLILTFLAIRKNERSLKELLKHKFFRVLFALLVLFGVMWTFDVYRIFFDFQLYTGIINTVLMSSVLIYLTLKLVSRETFFEEDIKRKYASSGLTLEGEKDLVKRITALFDKEKIFVDPKLNMSRLAEILEVPASYVSQSINNQLNLNFADYLNQWKVDEAKRLLKIRENHRLTLLYIAHKSGFKSSSAFNSAFRKLESTTPSKFRELHA